jgi:hypothetical protein
MSDLAVAKGAYLALLSDEEAKAAVATLLLERDLSAGRVDQLIPAANVILRHAPRSISALLYRGSAYGLMAERYRLALDGMPPEFGSIVQDLFRRNHADFAAAEALGWTEKEGVKK